MPTSLESAVYLRLQAVQGTGFVGPNKIPQTDDTARPWIIYTVLPGSPERAQSGISLRAPRLRLDIWADDYDTLLTIASQCVSLFDSVHADGLASAVLIGEQDMPDPNTGLSRRIQEYSTWGT